jgi:hypothetical protein
VRVLPPGERCMHALMGIVYGAFLAYLVPDLARWSGAPTGFGASYHGIPARILTLIGTGVFLSGVRDLLASVRPRPAKAAQ